MVGEPERWFEGYLETRFRSPGYPAPDTRNDHLYRTRIKEEVEVRVTRRGRRGRRGDLPHRRWPGAGLGSGRRSAPRWPRGRLPERQDRGLVRDALLLECDTFLTIERASPRNAGHLHRQTGLQRRPPEL